MEDEGGFFVVFYRSMACRCSLVAMPSGLGLLGVEEDGHNRR